MKVFGRVVVPAAAAKTGGVLKDFVWDQIMEGAKVTFEGGEVVLSGTDANIQPTFEDLVDIVANGGSFEGIKLAIQFGGAAAANQVVPEVVRGSRYVDEEGVTQERTWLDWYRASTGTQVITNGTQFVSKAMFNGQILNSEELTAIHAQTGITVIEWADAVALFQDEDWTEYEL
jgi:hypothetical protein